MSDRPDGSAAAAPSRKSFETTFLHLLEICREGIAKGNRRPAEILLRSCRTEHDLCARREAAILKNLEAKQAETARARRKARAVAALLGLAALPEPGPAETSPFAAVKARRRRDPLANLALSDAQVAAAGEIREVFEALTRGLHGAVRPLFAERVDGAAAGGDPFGAMPPRLARLHKQRYLPWARRQSKTVAERRGEGLSVERLTGVGLVVAALIDHVPVRRLEGQFRSRNGALGARLREALDDYWPAGEAPGDKRRHTIAGSRPAEDAASSL